MWRQCSVVVGKFRPPIFPPLTFCETTLMWYLCQNYSMCGLLHTYLSWKKIRGNYFWLQCLPPSCFLFCNPLKHSCAFIPNSSLPTSLALPYWQEHPSTPINTLGSRPECLSFPHYYEWCQFQFCCLQMWVGDLVTFEHKTLLYLVKKTLHFHTIY